VVAPSEVASLEAVGVAILPIGSILRRARPLPSGLIANLGFQPRVGRRERKIRFFQPDAYISVDYEARSIQMYRKTPPARGAQVPDNFSRAIGFGPRLSASREVQSVRRFGSQSLHAGGQR